MIKVYAFATPNSVRVPIALEELGLNYEFIPINVRKGEQKRPEYLEVNPNGKVPVIVDTDGPGGEGLTLSKSAPSLSILPKRRGSSCRKTESDERASLSKCFSTLRG